MAIYVAELHSLAEFCNFDWTLEAMLCDHIVCGINDDTIQRCLLAELGLTFKKLLEIVQSLEATAHHMRELHPQQLAAVKGRQTPVATKSTN